MERFVERVEPRTRPLRPKCGWPAPCS